MLKFRLVFLGVASALVLGAGTAMANVSWNGSGPSSPTGTSVTADADAHGDAVSAAAKSEASEQSEASEKSESSERSHGAREAAIDKCRAADVTEDKTEKKSSAHMTQAKKKLDRTEDKAEVKAFVACIKAAK